jgi:hypothetical protein
MDGKHNVLYYFEQGQMQPHIPIEAILTEGVDSNSALGSTSRHGHDWRNAILGRGIQHHLDKLWREGHFRSSLFIHCMLPMGAVHWYEWNRRFAYIGVTMLDGCSKAISCNTLDCHFSTNWISQCGRCWPSIVKQWFQNYFSKAYSIWRRGIIGH